MYITELTRHVISAQVLSQGRNLQHYLDLDLTPQSLNIGGVLYELFGQALQLMEIEIHAPVSACGMVFFSKLGII